MKSSIDTATSADAARTALCHHLAELLQKGANHVRVRLHRKGGTPDQAWFYSHQENQWHKHDQGLTQADLVSNLEGELAMIASRGKGDELSVRKVAAADWTDTDLQFHRDWLEERKGAHLESHLYGLLFRDTHGSGKDVRHNIRTPHHGA